MEDRIDNLETRLAFQEHTVEELDQALTAQQRQLDDLRTLIDAIRERLRQLAPSRVSPASEEKPPPHY